MSPLDPNPMRRMGCFYALIAVAFVAIGGLAAVTAMVAQAVPGNAESIRSLWGRAFFSGLLAAGATLAAVLTLRRAR